MEFIGLDQTRKRDVYRAVYSVRTLQRNWHTCRETEMSKRVRLLSVQWQAPVNSHCSTAVTHCSSSSIRGLLREASVAVDHRRFEVMGSGFACALGAAFNFGKCTLPDETIAAIVRRLENRRECPSTANPSAAMPDDLQWSALHG